MNIINGKRVYGVYRMIDPDAVDYAGNREMAGGYVDTEEEAEALCQRLNEEGDPK